jgi:restriction system protein
MPIPNFQSMMLPLLRIIEDKREHRVGEIKEKIAKEFKLTEEEKKMMFPSGNGPVFDNRVMWAIKYLKEAGLIESPKLGDIAITDKGVQVLKKNPEKIDKKFLLEYK